MSDIQAIDLGEKRARHSVTVHSDTTAFRKRDILSQTGAIFCQAIILSGLIMARLWPDYGLDSCDQYRAVVALFCRKLLSVIKYISTHALCDECFNCTCMGKIL